MQTLGQFNEIEPIRKSHKNQKKKKQHLKDVHTKN